MSDKIIKTILIVEDEFVIALDFAETIRSFGYEVIIANTGEKSVEIVTNNSNISLILMDIDLGKGIHGTEAAKQILKIRNIPIIFLTSHTEEEYVNKVKEITRYGYVIKDSGSFVLKSSIEMAFELFEAKEKLSKSEERLSFALDGANDGLWDVQMDTDELYLSRRGCEILGYNESELPDISKSWQNLVHPDDLPATESALNDYIEGRTEIFTVEQRLRTKSGEYKYVLARGRAVAFDDKGKPSRMVGTHTDISERKKVEMSLKEKKFIFQSLLDNSPIYIFFKDKDIKPIYLSKNYEQMLGMPIDEIIGKDMNELFPSDLAKSMIEDDKKILFGGKLIQVDEELNGKCYTTIKFPIQMEDSSLYLAGFTIDITERKKAEDKIKLLLKEKELLMKEVHHRIKNNMNVISNLLKMQCNLVKSPELITILNEAIGRVKSMEVLYSKLYQMDNYINVSINNYLSQLIDEIFALFPNHNSIQMLKEIEDFQVDNKILFILGIMINELISNSMKHAFINRINGAIKIVILHSNKHVEFKFEDNGIGIDSLESSKKKGFGLNLIDMLTQQINGNLEIERQNGTKFNIQFDI